MIRSLHTSRLKTSQMVEENIKEQIKELVGVFYQPPFKVFYINSLDGAEFIKPIGVFVSLGITTSLGLLENIKNIILSTGDYDARLVKISSVKKDINGQYLNTIEGENIDFQFDVSSVPPLCMDETGSKELLRELKSKLTPESDLSLLREYTPKVQKLSELIDKLDRDSSWDLHMIIPTTSGYKIFHKKVNYIQKDEKEYRIGIYVTRKEK